MVVRHITGQPALPQNPVARLDAEAKQSAHAPQPHVTDALLSTLQGFAKRKDRSDVESGATDAPHIRSAFSLTRCKHETASSSGTGRVLAQNPAITHETTKLDKVENPKNEVKSTSTNPNGLYRINYTIPTSGTGLSNITFPVRIDEAQQRKSKNDAGNYYAMQFGVIDNQGKKLGSGYIGLQPREDGKALVIFSGFGSNFKAPVGRPEADGGPGASSSTMVDFKFGHTYNLTVQRHPDNPKILQAYIQDVTNPNNPGSKQWVKDLHVTKDASLWGSHSGFVEHYGKSINNSAQIKPTSGSFSAPFTTDNSGNIKYGFLSGPELYGRYANSMTGDQTLTKESGKIKKVEFSLQGVT
ncbi:hypothetical protein [Burkholderia ubonensis]|uniref:hypothetical protein n=1 Tax=Burkholderia ubonensis TaxID=101571 RepID=UPI000AFE0F67|nr:hypothetical protein [Burkholderia ubonensis]